MKEDNWVSVAEIKELHGIPVDKIRRYIRCHGGHMRVEKVNNRYMIHNDSVNLFKEIFELYAGGKNLEEVEQTLSSGKVETLTAAVDSNEGESVPIHVADGLKRLNERLEQQYLEQKEFNKVLLEKLEQQERYINEKLDKRDSILVESLKLSMEERKAIVEAAVAMEKEVMEKKGFFGRLIGK